MSRGRRLVWRVGEGLPRDLVQTLEAGGLAVIPTDTLYALAARALLPRAVGRVYQVKGRDKGKALSLFFSRVEELEAFFHLSPLAWRLARRYLPGPLTLVLRPRVEFPAYLLGPTGGIGVRIPDHPLPRALVEALGEPITATSANISGERDPLAVEELSPLLLSQVELVVDGGKVLGIPSTVVDLTGEGLRVLREGAISARELEEYVHGEEKEG